MRGTVSINGNIDKSKISNPCDKELFISGNVTDSIIIHAQGILPSSASTSTSTST